MKQDSPIPIQISGVNGFYSIKSFMLDFFKADSVNLFSFSLPAKFRSLASMRSMYCLLQIKHKIKFHIPSVSRATKICTNPITISPLNNGTKKLVDELKFDDSQEFEKISGIAVSEGIGIDKVAHVIGLVSRDRLFKMENKSHTA